MDYSDLMADDATSAPDTEANLPQEQALRATMVGAVQQKPDEYAQAVALSRSTGLPAPVVARNLPQVAQQVQLTKYDDLVVDAPKTAQVLANNPDIAAVAHDDTHNLSALEQSTKTLSAIGNAGLTLATAPARFLNDFLPEFPKGLGGATNAAALSLNTVVGAAPVLYDKVAGGDQATAWWFNNMMKPRIDNAQAFASDPDAPFAAKLGNAGGNLLGMLSQIIITGGNPETASSLAGTVPEMIRTALTHATKSMAFPALTDAVNAARETYEHTGDAGLATTAATLKWTTTTGMGVVPLSAEGNLATRMATGAVSGVTAGESARVVHNAIMPSDQQQPFDPEETAISAITASILGGVMGPQSGVSPLRDSIERVRAHERAVAQANQAHDTFSAIGQLSEAGELRGRDPVAFEHFMQSVNEDSPVQHLFIDSRVLKGALDQSGAEDEFRSKMPEVAADMDSALKVQGDVQIPVEKYSRYVAGLPLDEVILPHLKIAPDALTMQEAQDALKAHTDRMTEEAQRIAGENAYRDQWAASAKSVEDNIYKQLEATGRFSSDVNRLYAALTRAGYEVDAARMGPDEHGNQFSPEDAFKKYPLRITGEKGTGAAMVDQARAPVPFDASKAPMARSRPQQGDALPAVTAVHYSKVAGLTELGGGFNGTGARGAEARRVAEADDARLRNRSYFYDASNGYLPERETGTGAEAHAAHLSNLYDFANDPQHILDSVKGLRGDAWANALESAILDKGYDGYRNGNSIVVLDGTVPVQHIGNDADLRREYENGQGTDREGVPGTGSGSGVQRGGSGGDASVAEAQGRSAQAAGGARPLEGLPTGLMNIGGKLYVPGPFHYAHEIAAKYVADRGRSYQPVVTYQKVIPERAKRIAQAFEDMAHEPHNPIVKASYEALAKETRDQWRAIKASGLKVEFIKGDDPYAESPRAAIMDVIDNNHLWVFPTDSGFGSSEADVSDNPLLAMSGEMVDGREMRFNDLFRIVHDYFGHVKDGVGFRADGEENAWRSHAAMYSPLARAAMTTETRGQNSWVNYGPHGEANRSATAADTVYATQKVGLLPNWVMEEGRRDPYIVDQLGEVERRIADLGNVKVENERRKAMAELTPSEKKFNQETLPPPVDEPVFYSALSREMGNINIKAAPAQGWKDALKGLVASGKVKADEVKWSGIEEFLDAHDGKVTKQEVNDFLTNYGVKVETVVRGDPDTRGDGKATLDEEDREELEPNFRFSDWETDEPDTGYLQENAQERFDEERDELVENHVNETWEDHTDEAREELGDKASDADVEARARELAADDFDESAALDDFYKQEEEWYWQDSYSPHSRQITVVVGDNSYDFTHESSYGDYRVYAQDAGDYLDFNHLPERQRYNPDDAAIQSAIISHLADQGVDFYGDGAVAEGRPLPTKWDGYVTGKAVPGSYREVLLTLPEGSVGKPEMGKVSSRSDEIITQRESLPDFHYDTHFPEANILGHFRYDEHRDAEGKRIMVVQEIQGDWGQQRRDALEQQAKYDEFTAKIDALKLELDAQVATDENVVDTEPWQALYREHSDLEAERARMPYAKSTPPDAPFIGKTTQWAALVTKRLIRMAVDNGFDKVVWTSGAQQVERWAGGLRKNVDKIAWEKTPEGIHIIATKNGNERVNTKYQENAISDAIGKAMAQQIIEDPNQRGEITGDNITISDTGMAGFYDKMLPNIVNEVLKKLDKSVRVNEIEVKPATQYEALPYTSKEGRQGFEVRRSGLPLNGVFFDTKAEADAFVEKAKARDETTDLNNQLGFEITDKMRESAAKAQPMFQRTEGKEPRAQITFGDDITKQPTTIALLKNADLSSFTHELGHFRLQVLMHMAQGADTTSEVARDANTVLKWFGINGVDTWHNMSLDEQRQYHEQFARGFEAYLFEGKSPNLQMQGIFSRVRAWMIQVYKQLSALNVELTPEVRGVMDRLMSSADSIQKAQEVRGMAKLFTEIPAGMDAIAFAEYNRQDQEAVDTALSQQQTRALRDMKWLSGAQSKVLRDLQAQAAAQRRILTEQATKIIGQEPVYKAMDWFKKGVITNANGDEAIQTAPEARAGAKLNRAEVDSLYPPGDLARPDLSKLAGMISDVGLHPDLAAEMFGFPSGRDLISALTTADRGEAIKGLTDKMMLEQHGEMNSPEAIQRSAEAAVHNELRARVIANEWRTLARIQGSVADLNAMAKEVAEKTIASAKIGDLSPAKYGAAEARASKEADKLMKKADLVAAAEAKRSQLLNNRFDKAASAALSEVEKAVAYFKRFDKKSIRAKLDPDDRKVIDDLLQRFDFRQKPIDKPTKQQIQLDQWIQAQRDLGYSPLVHPDMVRPDVRMPYKQMTVEQFRGLRDTIKSIEKIARARKTVTIEGQRMDVKSAVLPMVEKMKARGEKFTDAQIAQPTRRGVDPLFRVTLDRMSSWMRSFFGGEVTAQHFKANRYDNHEIMGPFHRYLFEPVFGANYHFVDLQKGTSDRLTAAAEKLGKEWQKSLNDKVPNSTLMDNSLDTPVLRSFTRGDMIGMAMHVGNESNFDKLVQGMQWSPKAVMKFLDDNMTRKDWDAVIAMGEESNRNWPEMVAMNKRLGNDQPAKIEPRPFMTKHGEMPGWYAPIRYDPIRSKLGKRRAADIAAGVDEGKFGPEYFRADTTTNGSLNNRAANYYDTIDLDWRTIEKGLYDSNRDLAYREALINARKLWVDSDFRSQFQRTYGPEEYKAIGTWLGHLVNDNAGDERQSKLTAIASGLRRAMVANGIAFRLSTMGKHGGSAAAKSAAYFNGGGQKYLLSRLKRVATNHSAEVTEALAKFPEIRARALQQDRDFRQAVGSIMDPESWHGKAERFGHAGVAWMDFLTAVPTAHAAYDWAITDGIPKRLGGTGKPMSEADAIKFASSVVREAHGTNIESGRSNLINNRSELIKSLTILHGFMNNALGQHQDILDKALHSQFGKPELLARYMMSMIVPAMVAGLVTYGAPEADKAKKWLFNSIGGEYAGMLPMVREAFAAFEGHDSAALPAWMRAITDTGKAAATVGKLTNDENVKHPIKTIGNAAGLIVPGLGQAGSTTQFLYDVMKGNQQPETVGEWIHGISTGEAKAHL